MGIYSWGASTYLSPPKDTVIRAITWAQVGTCAVFQALENGAYLAERGVLGWKKERSARAWVWSSRAWMVHVGLELVRLGYEWRQMKGQDWGRERRREMREEGALAGKDEGGLGKEREEKAMALGEEKGELELREEKVEDEEVREKWVKWQRELGVNAAYAPMTVHYSFEGGPLGEGSLGALGVVVGCLSIGRAWRNSA